MRNQGHLFFMKAHKGDTAMKKKIIIHLEDLTTAQEVLLQELLQTFCVEQIEVLEDITSTLLVGDLQIDVRRRQVWRAGNLIELTSMEFDILYLLAHHPGQEIPLIPAGPGFPAWSTNSGASWVPVSSKQSGDTGINSSSQASQPNGSKRTTVFFRCALLLFLAPVMRFR